MFGWDNKYITSITDSILNLDHSLSNDVDFDSFALGMAGPPLTFPVNLIPYFKVFGAVDGWQEIPNHISFLKVFELMECNRHSLPIAYTDEKVKQIVDTK